VGPVAIELFDVSKTFATTGTRTDAVSHVTFTAGDHEFISLIGPSGCGKTTILKLVSDLVPPTSGRISVNSVSPGKARKARSFGFVFQDATLLPWRTVLDNALLPLEVIGAPKDLTLGRNLLNLVGLEGFERHYPDQLSGGMQQRVAIARALSFNPGILLMDEPFGALDMITRDRMGLELLRIWQETRKTVLFVTHSIQEAVFLSDKVIVFTPRPARVAEIVDVSLPRPRSAAVRDTAAFLEYVRHLREVLEG
jgi:NitT/TauT family transport system ATP-binding protein